MAKLEAMLEQRGIATPREMSEAIARCQLHGGDVTTSLLQFVSADETQLSAALSECYGLPAAAVGLLPGPDDATLRSFPRDVAERYCCFPLEATPGRLVLAVAHPLEPALRDELASTLGVSIEQRVALEVRIRQAQAHFYGMPLSARNQRGIARLEGDVEGAGHETPLGMWSEAQLSTLPRPPSEVSAARDSQRPPSVRPRSPTPRDGTSAVRDGLGAVRYGTSAPPPSSGTRASRRRGPMPLAQARDELGRAGTRNDVLDIFFGFASQFFEYSALFAVHNSLAEGLDAWGKGADRDTVLGIGVPLDLPSSLSEVAESCKVRLTRLGKEGIDRTLAADLQRQFNAKALVLPVSLRGRCAVLLYADNGEADVVEREIADVIAIAPDVANALGRIILQRKKEVARQKSPDNADLSSLARRSQPAAANELGQPSTEPPSLLDALEPIVNENREKSRNNARRSSRPDASAAPLRAERESGSVSAQPVVSIGPDVPSPSPPLAGDVGPRSDPNSGEDPVFLLARPQGKARLTPVPPPPRPLPVIEKPPVSITHPARVIGKGPRLPSVIVDPESADAEASERLTRAAAITRAPTQARAESSGRRPLVPQLADAPRTLSPPQYERFATRRARTDGAASAQRGARERAAQRRDQQERDARRERQDERQSYERQVAPERELERREPPPSAPDPTDAAIDAGGLAAAALADVLASPSRTALHPASVDLAEPPSVPGALLEASADEPHDESASAEEPADEDAIGATSSNAWPPPIMDHSPPPRQPPLTALVPIIIADPPKGRRGYTSRTATTARPGSRPGIKSSVQRPGSIPPIHSPAAPTVPSPARARRVEPAVAEPLPSAPQQPAPNAETPIAVSADAAAPIEARAPTAVATASPDAASALGDAVPAAALASPGAVPSPSVANGGGSRLTNALARAAARASAASPRAGDPLTRLDAATTAPPPGPHAPRAASAGDAQERSPAPAPAAGPLPARGQVAPPPLQGRDNASPRAPRLVLPSASGERISRPPPAASAAAPVTTVPVPARSRAGAHAWNASDDDDARSSGPTSGSTVIGLGATSRGAAAAIPTTARAGAEALGARSAEPRSSGTAEGANRTNPAERPGAESVGRERFAAARGSESSAPISIAPSGSSTLIGVAAVNPKAAPLAARPEDAAVPAARTPAAEDPSLTRETPARGLSPIPLSSQVPTPPGGLPVPPLAALASTLGAASSPPPGSMLEGSDDGGPPDSVELAWDALISSPPPAPSAPPASGAAASSTIHAVPSPAGAAPEIPPHPVPSPPMSASSSNGSAAPSSPVHAAPISNPIPPIPSRSIDATSSAAEAIGQPTPSSPVQAPPSRPGSGSRPAVSSSPRSAEAPASRPGDALPSSVRTLAPASGTGDARAAIFPPPPPPNPEIEELVEQVCQGNLRAVQDLARIGAPSVPQVMARFPGPVISERAGPSSRASECGPLLQALAAIGSPAMPSITLNSEHADARVRRWATLLLGEMPSPEACRAVVQRLADDVPRVHQAALDAARLLLASNAADLFRKTLFEVAEAEDAPLTLRLRTLEHVAKLKDSASVPRLISFLGADMEPIVHKALWALTVVARHDFGRDTKAWTDFWNANQSRHRLEWLIDALDDRDPRLRKAAADELRDESGELFGYSEDAARPERLRAQSDFRRWWETTGAARYIRATP